MKVLFFTFIILNSLAAINTEVSKSDFLNELKALEKLEVEKTEVLLPKETALTKSNKPSEELVKTLDNTPSLFDSYGRLKANNDSESSQRDLKTRKR